MTSDFFKATANKPARILEYYPFSGNTTIRLKSYFPESQLDVVDVSLDIRDFIAGRFRRVRPSGSHQAPSFCLSSSFLNPPPLKDDYTLLICHKKINMSFPLDYFLKAASQLPNPTISLSYWSLFSFQGIIWSLLTKYKLKNLLCTNEGPFVPISPFT